MIGNRTGWIIAACILAIECAGVLYALSFDRHSAPTALTSPATLSAIALPNVPPSLMSTPGRADSTALYRAAIAEYLADVGQYETAITNRSRADLLKLPALDKILAARSAGGDAIFAAHLDEIIAYGEPSHLQAIIQLGQATYLAGTLYSRPVDRARAIEYYQASFALGLRLAREKLTWREYDAGVGLLSESGAAMAVELGRNPANAASVQSLQTFLDALREQRKNNLAIFEAIYSNNESKIATHAGDVFAFADESQEPMWRIEAIFKLGRMKHNVGNPPLSGNQRYASQMLRELQNSSDPAIHRAAEIAQALSVEEFRTLR